MLRLNPTHSIEKLYFSFYLNLDVLHIKEWISFAIERSVKDLTLEAWCNNQIEVPRELFYCKSLEALRLYRNLHLKIPKQGSLCFQNLKSLTLEGYVSISGIPDEENSPCFPKLITLCLKGVEYEDKDDCVMNLIRNCPILEDLTIKRVLEHKVSNVDMCIPQLTTVDLTCAWHGQSCHGLNVEIEAPIKNLTISEWNPTHRIIVKNLNSLTGARLRFTETRGYHYQGEQRDELLKLFKTVEKVTYLALLSHYAIDVIKVSSIRLPSFSNLILLEIMLGCKNFYMLERLLNHTNNLKVLVIRKMPRYICRDRGCTEEDGRWTEVSHVPKCVLTSLKRVEIIRYTECRCEFEMIKNMLNSAKVLEKLTWIETAARRNSLRQKISTFPRASASCKLDFPS